MSELYRAVDLLRRPVGRENAKTNLGESQAPADGKQLLAGTIAGGNAQV